MLRAYVCIGLIAAAAATAEEATSTTPDGTTDAPTTDAPPPPPARPDGVYAQVFRVTVKMEGKCADFNVETAASALATAIKVDEGLVTVTKSCADRRRLEDAKEPKPEKFTVSAQIGPVVDDDDEALKTTDDIKAAAKGAVESADFKVTDVEVKSRGKVVYPPRSPPSAAPSPPPSASPSPPCLDVDGCFDYGGPRCHAKFTKCSMWDADTGTHGPKEVEEVMKFGPYTCCDAGYICAPGGLNGEEGVFGGKTCTAEECKYWSCKPRAAGLDSIEAYKALKDDAEKEEDDDEDPPCVDNLDAKKDGKYKKKFCDKKKAQGKCDSKPRFMKKVCSKTCGFCKAAAGEDDKDGDKEPVAPPACENTPGKKKRKRGLEVWCENKAAKNQGKVSACPATAPSSPPPLLRPPAISRGGSHAPPPPRAPRPRSARRRRSAKSAARRARRSPTRGAPTARCIALTIPTVSRGPTVPSRAARRHSRRAKSSSGSPVSSLSASARTTTRAAARAATTSRVRT